MCLSYVILETLHEFNYKRYESISTNFSMLHIIYVRRYES